MSLHLVLLAINIVELLVIAVIITVLMRWAKRIIQFMDLMDHVTFEERSLKSRLEEWDDLMGNQR